CLAAFLAGECGGGKRWAAAGARHPSCVAAPKRLPEPASAETSSYAGDTRRTAALNFILFRTRAGNGAGTQCRIAAVLAADGRRSARADGQAGAGTERIIGRDSVISRGLERLVGNVEVQNAVVGLCELNLRHGLNPFSWLPCGAVSQPNDISFFCM